MNRTPVYNSCQIKSITTYRDLIPNQAVYTLLFFGGLHPLCGNGVTSLIITTSIPLFEIALIELSRPEPGPFTYTSTFFKPASTAVFAASDAAIWAA